MHNACHCRPTAHGHCPVWYPDNFFPWPSWHGYFHATTPKDLRYLARSILHLFAIPRKVYTALSNPVVFGTKLLMNFLWNLIFLLPRQTLVFIFPRTSHASSSHFLWTMALHVVPHPNSYRSLSNIWKNIFLLLVHPQIYMLACTSFVCQLKDGFLSTKQFTFAASWHALDLVIALP